MKVVFASTILALVLGALPAVAIEAYDQTLTLQGASFRIQCTNAASENTLTLTPSGLETDNSSISVAVDGIVTGAEVADLNADGSPEIYVYVTSAGSGSYGSLAAWSANSKKSLSPIILPELAEDPVNGKGYMGHDKFVVAEQYLVRSFPLYKEGDPNAAPSGGSRQLQYTLESGEASWRLVVAKTVDFE
jgi:hypothetical protein